MEKLKISNPFDESVIEELPFEEEKLVFDKLERAHQLFQDPSKQIPKYERIQILERLGEKIQADAERYAQEAAREGGKPIVDSRVEIARAIDGIKIAIRELTQLKGEEIAMGITPTSTQRMAFTIRQPRGVVLAISAFNHPFNLIIHQAIPAIAVGCPVLVKPALTTPLSARTIVNLLYESGLPEEWCQFVFCNNEVTGKLASDPRVSFLTFIGSEKVGWRLRSQMAPGATCALEHGGLAPVIFDKTADIQKNLPLLVKGGYYHAGQVCVSVQRVYVEGSIADVFIEQFTESVKHLNTGDQLDGKTEVGPLILPREVERVHTWVEEAVKAGASKTIGGEKISNTCYQPTVLVDPDEGVKVSQNEIFGPVVCLYRYDALDEAIRRANGPNVSFQAAIFTKEIDTALHAAKNLNALAVMINDHTAFRVDWMPFGGTKKSGLGIGGIGYTMKDMTLEKLLVFKSESL
ncbi:aldehyde dehydrogenase family protein [Nitrospira defluvii]|nr:aldehyde dehydrogenase family protein [Nitrospira defluvii]